VLVLDIGDSPLAPHQAAYPIDDPKYYFRQGGKSIAAPHHYLEALRNRFVAATLEVKDVELRVESVKSVAVANHEIPFDEVLFSVVFTILNTGRVACFRWNLECKFDNLPNKYSLQIVPPDPVNQTVILPTRAICESKQLTAMIPALWDRMELIRDIRNASISFDVVGEQFVGEKFSRLLGDCVKGQLDSQWDAKVDERAKQQREKRERRN
jgi:hypothetical protein